MSKPMNTANDQLQSVAERLNVFQDVESREQKFEHLSRDLTNNLFILLRAAGLYDLDNQALDQPYEMLLNSIRGLFDLLRSRISLRLNDGNFFINRRLVKLDFSTFQNARYLIKIFNFLEINELNIEHRISRDDLKVLLQTFVHVVREKKTNFKDISIPNIEAKKLDIGKVHPLLTAESPSEKVAALYGTACFVTQNFYKDTYEERAPQHAQLKRVVIDLIECPKPSLPLLARLDLLAADQQQAGTLFIHSVEAAGLTTFIIKSLQFSADLQLAMTTAALQLFQGWSLLKDQNINYNDPSSTAQIFTALESTQEEITRSRNEIIKTLLDLGGISESVVQRILMTFEAQRSQKSQWDEVGTAPDEIAKPSKAWKKRLYKSGLSRSIFSDIVYGAHLFCYLRRTKAASMVWSEFHKAALSKEVIHIFYSLIGQYPFGSRVRLNNGDLGIVTSCEGENVSGIAIVENAHNPLTITVSKRIEIRPSSPIQVKDYLSDKETALFSIESQRALIFSHLTSSTSQEDS